MITTIQIDSGVKNELNRFKRTGKESYEQIILEMIREINTQKRRQKELLIEGCKEMAEDSLRICEEFKYADAEIECEWDGDL